MAKLTESLSVLLVVQDVIESTPAHDRLKKGRPDFDPTSKWRTKGEYELDRNQWLMPWADSIVGILQALTKEMVTVDAS